jgi:hypothetical protein
VISELDGMIEQRRQRCRVDARRRQPILERRIRDDA